MGKDKFRKYLARQLRKGTYEDIPLYMMQNYTVEGATENLLLFTDILDKYSIDYWLAFGTLLGIYRDGKLIENDGDIDLGMKMCNFDKFIPVDKELHRKGFAFAHMWSIKPDWAYTIAYVKDGIPLGLHGYQRDKDVWSWGHDQTYYPPSPPILDSQISNLRTIQFKGKKFKTVNNVEDYLLAMYGKTWGIPSPIKNIMSPGFIFDRAFA